MTVRQCHTPPPLWLTAVRQLHAQDAELKRLKETVAALTKERDDARSAAAAASSDVARQAARSDSNVRAAQQREGELGAKLAAAEAAAEAAAREGDASTARVAQLTREVSF
jgi:seryl-tRNA synthetase